MQGNLLALGFIPLGALLSVLIVIILSGVRWLLYDMAIVLLSGFLIFAVIKFALRKPAKLLAKTSPIEAMKFQGERPDKDTKHGSGLHQILWRKSKDLQTQIYKIPCVEKIVLDGCVVGRLVESKVVYDSPEDNLETVNSLSPELVANASELVDGTINYDEIGLDGIVVNKYRTDRSDTNYGDLKIGDTLSFHFDVAGQTIEKTFAVPGLRFPVRPADIASVRVNARRIL